MRIGVVSDIVIPKSGNYVASAATLQCSCLFSNHLESRRHPFCGQKIGQSFRRVIARRKYVIFSVKPDQT